MRAEIYIARKLRLSPRDERKRPAPSVGIAVGGIALAFIVMTLTIAVVCGFKKEITAKVTGFDAQLSVVPMTQIYQAENQRLEVTDSLLDAVVSALPEGASATPTLSQPGILKTDSDFLGVVFRGYGADGGQFAQLEIVDGKVPDFAAEESRNLIMVSEEMAAKLRISVGDKINTYFFSHDNLRLRRLEIAAVYRSNFGEFDSLVAYASLPLLRRVAGVGEADADKIEVRGLPADKIVEEAERLQMAMNVASFTGGMGVPMYVDNVYRSDAPYFNWLELLDMNVVVILILIGCVAGFTLIACLFIVMLERVRTIGLLKSLGATNAQIRRVFLWMASRIVLKGLIIGNLLTLAILWAESSFHLLPLDPQSYYLNYVSVEISAFDVVVVNAAVVVVSIALTLIPASMIAKITPTKTLRYE